MVMSNLGYFQLKANPGVWIISLAPNTRSSEIYQIVQESNTQQSSNEYKVAVVSSFTGTQMILKTQKRPGKENEKLFDESKFSLRRHRRSYYSSAWELFEYGLLSSLLFSQNKTKKRIHTHTHIYLFFEY
jgi:hypothetical protein